MKHVSIAALILLLGIQFIPVGAHNSAPVAGKSIYEAEPVPDAVRTIFQTSCSDCHSDQTHWPWYSHLAPVSWLVVHDVHSGRRHFNLSEWGNYSSRKKEQTLESICEQVTNGDMPDSKYAFIHRKVRLTQDQLDALCAWVESAH